MKAFRFAAALLSGAALSVGIADAKDAPSVVLVHGAVMDGSAWQPVYRLLRKRGLDVSVAQLPLTGLDADVAATRQIIDQQEGPVVLVGASYGGAVISVAGNDPKVKSLVYVAALQPAEGESVAELNARWPLRTHAKMLQGSVMIVDPTFFAPDVAADLSAEQTDFLAHAQRPTDATAFTTRLPAVAWDNKPSYGIVALDDKSISPEEERFMYRRSKATITEIHAGHLVHLSHPRAVADVIEKAVRAAQ